MREVVLPPPGNRRSSHLMRPFGIGLKHVYDAPVSSASNKIYILLAAAVLVRDQRPGLIICGRDELARAEERTGFLSMTRGRRKAEKKESGYPKM
jgi:hypothetical protein